jgi:hypothetical protein
MQHASFSYTSFHISDTLEVVYDDDVYVEFTVVVEVVFVVVLVDTASISKRIGFPPLLGIVKVSI